MASLKHFRRNVSADEIVVQFETDFEQAPDDHKLCFQNPAFQDVEEEENFPTKPKDKKLLGHLPRNSITSLQNEAEEKADEWPLACVKRCSTQRLVLSVLSLTIIGLLIFLIAHLAGMKNNASPTESTPVQTRPVAMIELEFILTLTFPTLRWHSHYVDLNSSETSSIVRRFINEINTGLRNSVLGSVHYNTDIIELRNGSLIIVCKLCFNETVYSFKGRTRKITSLTIHDTIKAMAQEAVRNTTGSLLSKIDMSTILVFEVTDKISNANTTPRSTSVSSGNIYTGSSSTLSNTEVSSTEYSHSTTMTSNNDLSTTTHTTEPVTQITESPKSTIMITITSHRSPLTFTSPVSTSSTSQQPSLVSVMSTASTSQQPSPVPVMTTTSTRQVPTPVSDMSTTSSTSQQQTAFSEMLTTFSTSQQRAIVSVMSNRTTSTSQQPTPSSSSPTTTTSTSQTLTLSSTTTDTVSHSSPITPSSTELRTTAHTASVTSEVNSASPVSSHTTTITPPEVSTSTTESQTSSSTITLSNTSHMSSLHTPSVFPSSTTSRDTIMSSTVSTMQTTVFDPCTDYAYLERLVVDTCLNHTILSQAQSGGESEKCRFIQDFINCILLEVKNSYQQECTAEEKRNIINQNSEGAQEHLQIDITTCFPELYS